MERTRIRKYGNAPYLAALLHGGPGAPGSMAPLAAELCGVCGVIEPLQLQSSVEGQVEGLGNALQDNATVPVTLLGWSWGAWLACLLAADRSGLVNKLILVGSPPFTPGCSGQINSRRLERLEEKERREVSSLMQVLDGPAPGKDSALRRLGELFSKADSFLEEPVEHRDEEPDCRVFKQVWSQAEQMRSSGQLLEAAGAIRCPVLAVHGDFDPHPWQGVAGPLEALLPDFRLVLLEDCGHRPWLEYHAKTRFLDTVKQEFARR